MNPGPPRWCGFGAILALLLPAALPAQVTTAAGTGVRGPARDPSPALSATLDNPFGVVRGPDGALWFCEYDGQRIRRLDPQGTVHTVAGTGVAGYSGDGGPAGEATFHQPHELRFDADGHLFIADMRNHVIRRMDAQTRRMSTVAGTGEAGYSGDGGPATAARLRQPHSIQFGPDRCLYIGDIGNHVIRRLDPQTGRITTIAGTGKPGPTPDHAPIPGTPLNGPRALDFDAAGHLWVATREGNQVFELDLAAGVLRHRAGTGGKGFTGNGGPAIQATLSGAKGLAIGPDGNVYLADTESHSIRRLDLRRGTIERVVGTGDPGDGPDGDPASCRLARPHGLWLDPDGTLWIGDSENHRIRRLPGAARARP